MIRAADVCRLYANIAEDRELLPQEQVLLHIATHATDLPDQTGVQDVERNAGEGLQVLPGLWSVPFTLTGKDYRRDTLALAGITDKGTAVIAIFQESTDFDHVVPHPVMLDIDGIEAELIDVPSPFDRERMSYQQMMTLLTLGQSALACAFAEEQT